MKLTHRFQAALNFSFDLHREQERKDTGIPYFSHLLSVAALAMEFGADEDQTIAALLHDSAEDQGGETVLEEIAVRFGKKVADLVRACTDNLDPIQLDWKSRKIAYLAHLASASREAQLIALCDKLHNLRCIVSDYRSFGDSLWTKFQGRKDGVLWYYAELCTVFPKHLNGSEELNRLYQQLLSLIPSHIAHGP